ncbi:ATP-binding protein [Nonlabens antarcticus]|uniref:ATP-binding protein n=1 Tax=Nonlabens antarcticus TaxID=392714 RepID=UPI001891AF29|nr:HAMP domain-containing sensor histidine kinase [Nonlabens antarcticus]
MNDKPTYKELLSKLAALQEQNDILCLDFSLQTLERDKHAAELEIANIELKHQNGEKKKRAAELKIANVELEHQNLEKEKRAAELIIANIELEHQSKEKGKRAAELVLANIELEHQQKEKEKRAEELKIANVELKHESSEKKKRAAELIIANVELVFQKEEKAKRAAEFMVSKIKLAQQDEENEKLEEELAIANLAVSLQSELVIAKEKAEQNETQVRALNATKDKLFSIIAHDLRSPFHSIIGLSNLLAFSVKSEEKEEMQSYIEMLSTSAKSTLDLLDNLLEWAKSQTGLIKFNPVKVNLEPIIVEIFDILNPTAEIKRISLNYDQSVDIEIDADENMLKTVLRNLIYNAIKFTNSNGRIDIYACNMEGFIEITVKDNGIGIMKSVQDKLFNIDNNISTRGTADEQGSGLGLILCKEFINKHSGKIWIDSKEGKGSSFKFSLPFK